MSKKKTAKIKHYCHAKRAGAIELKTTDFPRSKSIRKDAVDFSALRLEPDNQPGVFFGRAPNTDDYIGMPEGSDGNLIIIGGNGSGKSRGIAMQTLKTWNSAIVATDIKGELSAQYAQFWRSEEVVRPYLVFDPTRADGPSYDPFWWLQNNSEINEIENVWDIARAIMPLSPEDKQPFWVETEQALFAAALLECFHRGLSFSECICLIVSQPVSSLSAMLMQSADAQVKMMLGQVASMKDEALACIDRGFRNRLMLFATDAQISHALRGERETANCFSWDDLREKQIFICIPTDKLDQWSGVVNLMYAQLFRYLERRPEQHTLAAAGHPQLLVLMDEFARFGKINGITAALSTLRSKKVNLALFVQSIAQIDRFYGAEERRIILDNCQWKGILRANDPETQEFLSRCIGTSIYRKHSIGKQMDRDLKKTGYTMQISETRDHIIAPHELSTLNEVLLLTPDGFFRIEKELITGDFGANCEINPNGETHPYGNENGGIRMKTIEERVQDAKHKFNQSKYDERKAARQAQEAQKKESTQRQMIVGALVVEYFPALESIKPAKSKEENQKLFQHLANLLAALADSPDLMQELRDRAKRRSGPAVCQDDV